MEAVAHLLPQSVVAAKTLAQHQLGNGGNVCRFKNSLGQGISSSVTARTSAKLDGILEYSARIRIGNCPLQHQFAVPHRNPITENGMQTPATHSRGFFILA